MMAPVLLAAHHGMADSALLGAALLVSLVIGMALSAGLLIHDRDGGVGSYITGREADLAHLSMNAAMAWMLTPLFTEDSRRLVIGSFSAMAAVFVVLLLVGTVRPDSHWRWQRPVSGYHLVATLAMIYATAAMMAPTSTHAHGMTDMPGMDMPAAQPSALAWVLAAAFGLDAIGTVLLVLLAPDTVLRSAMPGISSADGTTRTAPVMTRPKLRIASVPHVVMDVGMVAMLVGTPGS